MPILIIFIDSFPYDCLGETEFIKSLPSQYKITPSFGYSVNLHAELFAGFRPDDVGYFGEWSFNPHKDISWIDKIVSRLNFLRRFSPFLDGGLHYVLHQYFNYQCANIPFDSLDLFQHKGGYPLRGNWEYKTIFDEFGFATIAPDFLPLPSGKKDKYSYTKAKELINQGEEQIFVSFPGLDGVAHKFGMDSSQYKERIGRIDNYSKELVARFLTLHSQGRIVILSDHGMARAKEKVSLQLEKRFGRPDVNRLVYFYDSLYLRIWIQRHSLRKEITDFLQKSKAGNILTREERAFWGLSDPKLGEIIFLLKEGYAFAPNYFGFRLLRAYHGYHPDLESQKCIFLFNGSGIRKEPRYLIDVYHALRKLIQIDEDERY